MLLALCAVLVSSVQAATPVILISIDTLRADHLGVYGYSRIHTPSIDSYAQHGTVFDDIACQAPLTLPSHTALFTSTYPFQNRVEENAEPVTGDPLTLATVLRARGYRTAAFIGSVFLERQMGLDKGFDFYDSPFSFAALSPLSGEMLFAGRQNNFTVRDRRDGALVLRAAIQWMSANRGQNAFAFLHLFDLHKPYLIGTDEARRSGMSQYDAEIEYVDGLLLRFRNFLQHEGWWDRSLVIVLSDHGEGLGEHGEDAHGYFVYQSTVHVPLIVHWPSSAAPHPARASAGGGLIDVAPTILASLGIPIPPAFDGHNLLDGGQHDAYTESMHAHDAFGWAPLRALRAGRYKYIDAPHPEFYDLSADPGETSNVIGAHAAEAQILRRRLQVLLAKYASPGTAAAHGSQSPEAVSALQSLGYLAHGPGIRAGSSGPDPKDRLGEFHVYEQAEAAAADGRPQAEILLLRRILTRDPENPLVLRDLGSAYLELHRYASARTTLERVLRRAPDDYMTLYETGLADQHLGLRSESIAMLRRACRAAPAAEQCRHELQTVEASAK